MTRVQPGSSSASCWLGAVLVAGLVHVAAAGAAEPVVAEGGADGVQHATITLDSYSYIPDHLVIQAGKPVEATLHSVTTLTPHNFILNDAAARHGQLDTIFGLDQQAV